MLIDIRIPDLGFSANEAIRLGLWYAQEGDRLYQGDHLAELRVSAAVVDLDAPADGILVERLAGPEDVLRVGQVIARMSCTTCSTFLGEPFLGQEEHPAT